MPSEHALLSASDADRWIHCPRSVRLTQSFKDSGSAEAEEGAIAHALAELNLRFEYEGPDAGEIVEYKQLQKNPLYNKAMADYVREFENVVHEQYAEAVNAFEEMRPSQRKYLKSIGVKEPLIFFEARVDTSDYIPEGFGTSDVVIIGGNKMFITDLKYGKGKPVSALDNPQLKAYGLGAMKSFKKYMDFVQDITFTIVQPRLHDRSSTTIRSTDLMRWGKTVLRPAANKAYCGQGELLAGSWCQWCPIKDVCKKRAETLLAGVDFTPEEWLSPSEVAEIVNKGSEVKQWIDKVEKYALKLAIEGVHIDGYKVVQGRSGKRTVRDPEALAIDLQFEGYPEEDIYKPPQMKGIGDLEKTLGLEAFSDLVGPYLTQAEGQPKLAKESDKRPEWKSFDASQAFDDLSNE